MEFQEFPFSNEELLCFNGLRFPSTCCPTFKLDCPAFLTTKIKPFGAVSSSASSFSTAFIPFVLLDEELTPVDGMFWLLPVLNNGGILFTPFWAPFVPPFLLLVLPSLLFDWFPFTGPFVPEFWLVPCLF